MNIATALNIAREIKDIDFSKCKDEAGFNFPAFLSLLNEEQINKLFSFIESTEIKKEITDNKVPELIKGVKELVILDLIRKFDDNIAQATDFEKKLVQETKGKGTERKRENDVKKPEKKITYYKYILDIMSRLNKAGNGNYDLNIITLLDGVVLIDIDNKDNKRDYIYSNLGKVKEIQREKIKEYISDADLEDHNTLDYILSRINSNIEVKNG